jgi:CDP-glucose 4,6-dehydratase
MGPSLADFYRGKKVLITGHTGFKGSWLSIWLRLFGANVVGFALPPETEPNLFTAAHVGQDLTSVFGDIRELSSLLPVFRQHNPDIVIHNAAQPLVRRSYREPVQTYATNIMGTVHALEAARLSASVRAIVVVTSDKCYDNRAVSRAYREDDPVGGHDPYSSSKGAAEIVTAAYRRSFFSATRVIGVASARAGNVIGGGDWSEDRLLPDIVRAVSTNKPVLIRQPDAVRPWQHVLEPLRGYLQLARSLYEEGEKYSGAWNFGPPESDAATVVDVARATIAKWGAGELEIYSGYTLEHEAKYLRLNSEKALRQLGWRTVVGLHQALAWTVEWYRAFYEKSPDPRSVTESQIERYMSITAA